MFVPTVKNVLKSKIFVHQGDFNISRCIKYKYLWRYLGKYKYYNEINIKVIDIDILVFINKWIILLLSIIVLIIN